MQEGNVQALGTFAGFFVHYSTTFLLHLGKSVGYAVFNSEGDVLDAATATILLDEFCNGAVGAGSFEQFNLSLSHLEESGFHVLVFYFFNGEAFETK